MKLFIFFLISFLFKYEIFANELSFTYDVKGTLVKEEKVIFPSGKKFISFRHEGGFETSIARYGFYYCTGSMLYTENGNLEDMTYACEFQDQNNDKFFGGSSEIMDKLCDIYNIIPNFFTIFNFNFKIF